MLDPEEDNIEIYGHRQNRYIKKNGLTDVNIFDRKDWIMAVFRPIH